MQRKSNINSRPGNLPSLEEITDAERAEQLDRATRIAPGVIYVARQVGAEKDAQAAAKKQCEIVRQNTEHLIKREAKLVAAKLVKNGKKPDVMLSQHTSVDQPRSYGLKAKGAKVTHHKPIEGWVLTPPQGNNAYNRPTRWAPVPHGPGSERKGFFLATDGTIHTYGIKQALRRDHGQGMQVLLGTTQQDQLVRANQITAAADGTPQYEDKIAPHYGFAPDAGIAPTGYDDLSMIHGLGIRQALGALNARAEQRQQP